MNERRVATVCAAVLVATAAWMLVEVEAQKEEVAAAPARPSVVTASLAAAEPQLSAAPPRRRGEARHAPLADDEVEVCGLGRIKGRTREDAATIALQRMEAAARPVIQRLTASLIESADAYDRALGRMLRIGPAEAAAEASMVASEASCSESADCRERAAAAAGRAGAADRSALVGDAIASGDPRIYAVAWSVCRRAQDDARCQQLSSEQWAQTDPTNAMPWLQVANDAAKRGDAGTVEEALFRVSKAQRSDPRFGAVLELLQYEEVASQPPAARLGLITYFLGLAAAQPMPSVDVVVQRCRAPLDVNRQQQCSDVATVLIEHGATPVEWAVGLRLGRNAGWSDERIRELEVQRDAMFQLMREAPWFPRTPSLSCEAYAQINSWIGRLVVQGEVAAWREQAERAPGGVAAAAERARQRKRTEAKAAANQAKAESGDPAATAVPL